MSNFKTDETWEETELSEVSVDTEERCSSRFPVRASVCLSLFNGVQLFGSTNDMSTTGAFVLTEDYPYGLVPEEEGRLFLAEGISNSDTDHRFSCEIVRVDDDGVAIRFI